MEKVKFANDIYALGYLSIVESIIEKAVKLLALETSTAKSKELYRLVILQAYKNLEELATFLEAGSSELSELTCSPLVTKSLMLISDPNYSKVLDSLPICTQIASFLKNLSDDNVDCKNLLTPESESFIKQFQASVSQDN